VAVGLGIDSVTRHPGMVVIGHHDRAAMEKLRQAAVSRGGTVRIVDQKTVVMPVHDSTAADPDRLLAAVRTLLKPPAKKVGSRR
jgi:adenosylmethionine-8-amino-7-oxononanoate aminotransferase